MAMQYVLFDQLDIESIHAGFGHNVTNDEQHPLSWREYIH